MLSRSFNASYGDSPYSEKLEHYLSQNLLARSLHPQCYEHNPRFLRLTTDRGLSFEPHRAEFNSQAIQQRQSLYQEICAAIWDPVRLGLAVPDQATPDTIGEPAQRYYGVSFGELVSAGLVHTGDHLTGSRSGQHVTATVTATGRIRLPTGDEFDTPSSAAIAALHVKSWNGWDFWRVGTPNGPVRLSRIRQDYLQARVAPITTPPQLAG